MPIRLKLLLCLCSLPFLLHSKCNKDTVYTYTFQPGKTTKILTGRNIYKYNDSGDILNYLSQQYDSVSKNYTNQSRATFTINTDRQTTYYLYENWDNIIKTWVNNTNYSQTFNTNKNITEYHYKLWNKTSKVWYSLFKYQYSYAAKDHIYEKLRLNWNTTSNTWDSSNLDRYIYDDSLRVSTYYLKSYSSLHKAFIYEYKINYQYDNVGNTIWEERVRWNPGNNEWLRASRYERIFNSRNQILQNKFYSILNDVLYKNQVYTYQYDTSGNELVSQSKYYDIATDSMVTGYRINSTYNAKNQNTETTSVDWSKKSYNYTDTFYRYIYIYSGTNSIEDQYKLYNKNSQRWDNYYKYVNKFNSNNDLIQRNYFTWDTLNNAWMKQSERYYDFNGSDLLSSDNFNTWDSAAGYYITHGREEYRCLKTSNPSSLTVTRNTGISIYPNPSTFGVLNIISQQYGTMQLYNLMGILVKTISINTGLNTLNCAGLQKGFYIIIINSEQFKWILE